jgi:hypothetical protein
MFVIMKKYEIISAVRMESVNRERVESVITTGSSQPRSSMNGHDHDVLPRPAAISTSDEDIDEVDNRLLPLSCSSTTSSVSPPSILASSYSSASAIGS